jgi:acetyltransferase-like isoleucine patch superfamily enzyme
MLIYLCHKRMEMTRIELIRYGRDDLYTPKEWLGTGVRRDVTPWASETAYGGARAICDIRGPMKEEFRGSTQKDLLAAEKSLFAKYRALFVGEGGFWKLLRFELVNLFFSWIPGALGLWARKTFYPALFRSVGRVAVFGRNITLRHPHKVSLGSNCFIDDNVVLDAKGEANRGLGLGDNVYIGRNTILSCKEGDIVIGDHSNISANCSLLSETEIRLGKYCFLAGHCYLVAGGNHSFADLETPIMFQPSFSRGGIRIADDVWLAAGVIVLDGVTIERGCVVGAGAVVTQSLPEFTVAVGSPARKIRDRRDREPQSHV